MSALEAACLKPAGPILIARHSRRWAQNVLIAWNCSTEQARATAFAMPILKRARRVIVLTVQGGAAVPGPTAIVLLSAVERGAGKTVDCRS
jgi:hypothetical protein